MQFETFSSSQVYTPGSDDQLIMNRNQIRPLNLCKISNEWSTFDINITYVRICAKCQADLPASPIITIWARCDHFSHCDFVCLPFSVPCVGNPSENVTFYVQEYIFLNKVSNF